MPWNAVIAQFEGFAEPPGIVSFNAASYILSSNDFSPFAVSATFFTRATGLLSKFTESAGSGTTEDIGSWTTDAPDAGDPGKIDGADYEAQVTFVSGDAGIIETGVGLGVWVPLGIDRQWNFRKETGIGEVDAIYLIEIRDVATMTLQDSANINVFLQRDNP